MSSLDGSSVVVVLTVDVVVVAVVKLRGEHISST